MGGAFLISYQRCYMGTEYKIEQELKVGNKYDKLFWNQMILGFLVSIVELSLLTKFLFAVILIVSLSN